ncbi:MAG: heparinase II/III-family protein [Bacteroidetes bacterium]|nr:heparinase II/III-family protein [Bacteroidota bacterium]
MYVVKNFVAVIIIILSQQCFIYSSSKNNSKLLGRSIVTEKVNYKQNFEEGSINGWEPYPPFQDTGFDPNFYCKRIDGPNGSQYSLMFEYHPTFKTEHEMGFIKKLLLIAADNSKISFYYKADGYGDFKDLKIVLYGTNGQQYSRITSIRDNGKWNLEEARIQNFKNSGKSIKPGTGISGFSVVTHIPKTNPDITYRLYFDDLKIAALQPIKFQIINPASDYLKNLDMIVPLHHYHAGENFSFSGKLPRGTKLKSVNLNLINPEGKIILKSVLLEFNPSSNLWSKNNIYTFSTNDALGQWGVKINGEDGSGKKIETKFKIWLTQTDLTHPRLFLTNKEINYCKEKIKSKHWKNWWKSLVKEAANVRNTSNLGSIEFGAETSSLRNVPPTNLSLESLSKVDITDLDSVYLLPTIQHYFDIMVPTEKILDENALIYALTGDTAAGDFARQALLIISGWKTWTHPWFTARHRETYYPIGELGVRAAFCYDIVYPLMTKEERDKVSEGLLKNCIIPAFDEYVLQDRVPSATSNWVSNTVSGGICCALSIYGDNPKLGNLEPYLSGLIRKLEMNIHNTLDTAGAWGEGIGYQGFAFSNTLPTLSAIKNVLNLDLSSKSLFNSYKYFLYNFSNPGILDVGDSHPELSTLSEFAWLSSHSNDPVFKWLYKQSPRNNIFDFMFGSDKGEETSPISLPKSKEFPEIGAVVFRSGWSPDDIVLNFRSGHFYNHQHFDQGSFQLNAFGETLVPEAGYANYYNDPRYRSYYIQPVGHNTLLLDEDAGSQRSGDYLHFIKAANRSAKLKDFITTDFFSEATGELSDVYRGKLFLFERNIIFMDQKYFVIYDRLKSSKVPHEYDLLFHFEDSKDVNLKQNNIFTFTTDKASLYSQVLFPENIKMTTIEGPINFGVPIRKPGYVQVSNSNKSLGENFLTILYPEKGNKNILNVSKDITKLKGDNYIGIEVKINNQTDKLFFSTAAGKTGKANIKTKEIATDAEIAEVTLNDNKILNFAVNDASNFVYDGNKLFETNVPVTTAVKLNPKTGEWKIISNKTGEANIYLSSEPKEIILNGNKLKNSDYKLEGKELTIPFSIGNNSIQIEY